jgi:formylglycine-generating enzyme required for sulfatase activity
MVFSSPLLEAVGRSCAAVLMAAPPTGLRPEALARVAGQAWEVWAASHAEDQRRVEVRELAGAPPETVRWIAERVAAGLISDSTTEGRVPLVGLLAALPACLAGDAVPTAADFPRLLRSAWERSAGPAARPEQKALWGRGSAAWRLLDSLQEEPAELPKRIAHPAGIDLVLIPAGTFTMGTSGRDARHSETPPRAVTLTRSFYLGVLPVTQGQYQAVMGHNPSRFTSGNGGGPDHPVEGVRWAEAVAYCRQLTEKLPRQPCRLPTEAEWEYACRAGTAAEFAFGDTLAATHAHFNALPSRGAESLDGARGTKPAGVFPANNFGLHDVHGNVWEWCADWFDPDYYRAAPARNPVGPPNGRARVVRGGCWRSQATTCRAAYRNALDPERANSFTGFRVVCEVAPP